MSKNKSFFQKLSDSLTSLFPFNSTTRENVSQVSFEHNLSPIITSNRRVASVAFGKDEDESKIKRARLHYDLKSLPTSRIIKPNNTLQDKFNVYNNFNDTASEISEVSNISVSTSGVSSLHPRSSKRLYLGNTEDISMNINSKYPRNLNVSQKIISPISNKSFRNAKEFISSPAKKILEKLDKLTTPITAADKLTTLLVKERMLNPSKFTQPKSYSPYGRPIPPIAVKRPLPIKAVTISGSSNDNLQSNCGPIRSKYTKKMKRLGYVDDIDLDSEPLNNNYEYPKLNEVNQLNFSNIPTLKKSISTNTEEPCLSSSFRSPSPDLEFTFRPPQTVNDEEYLSIHHKDTVNFQFKSKISDKERSDYQKRINGDVKSDKLWRCDTCFNENFEESLQCTNCENISKKNLSTVILSEKKLLMDQCNVLNEDFGNNTRENLPIKCNLESVSSEVNMDFSKLSSITTQSSIPESCNSTTTVSSVSSSLSSDSRSSIFNTKVEVSRIENVFDSINGSAPLEMNNASVETSNSKCFSLGNVSTTNESLAPISSSKSFLIDDSTKELNNSKQIILSQASSIEVTPVICSVSVSLDSTSKAATFVFGKLSNAEVVSSSVPTTISLSFGDKLSKTPWFNETSNTITASSCSITNPILFGQDSSTGNVSFTPVSTFSINQTTSGKSMWSNNPSFSFGQSSSVGNTSLLTTSLNTKTFSNATEKSLSFETSKPETTSSLYTTNPIFSGQNSSSGVLSFATPVSTFSINQTSDFSASPSFSFGQFPTASNASMLTSFNAKTFPTATNSILFGQNSSSGNSSIMSTSTFSNNQTSGKSDISANPSFSFVKSSTSSSSSSVNSKPFQFVQTFDNGETPTSKPAPFVFGQVPKTEVNAGGGGGGSNSKPVFGQSLNTDQISKIAQPSFTNPGSSLFGDYQKTGGSASSLFGNNSVSQSSYSGGIFGSQTVTTATPSIEPPKPTASSFAFNTTQPMNLFGTQSTPFNSTPQLNFNQSTVNQTSSQFSLPSNNNQPSTVNVFGGAPQNNPFQFGGSAAPANNSSFANPVSNAFGGNVAAADSTGFHFNSNSQGLFQFGSSNGPNSSSSCALPNARRTLKSRRKKT